MLESVTHYSSTIFLKNYVKLDLSSKDYLYFIFLFIVPLNLYRINYIDLFGDLDYLYLKFFYF